MNELVQQISQKTGIGEDKARQAAEVAINFLKSRFPAIGGHLDSFLQGGQGGGIAQKAEQDLGGMLGKKSA
jgi:hypothetical protein